MEKKTQGISTNKKNWWIDIAAFIVFVVVSAPHATGVPLHEWISAVLFGLVIVHLVIHWEWIVEVTRRMFRRLPGETRVNQFMNVVIFVMMNAAMVTGIMISKEILPTLGITLQMDRFWRALHGVTADLSVLLIGVHLALHWKWIVNAFKRYVLRRPQSSVVHASTPTNAV